MNLLNKTPRKLKLGFIMGGGVSLGSFSGAALSESLKQLILFAQYPTDQTQPNGKPIYAPYDSVEIDVFSGASAGAVSLGVMIRVLVNHRDRYKLLGYPNYQNMRESIEQKLFIQFGEPAYKLKQENPTKFESLVAVQVMQEVQTKLWTDEIQLDKLLGAGAHYQDLTEEAGLVDRGVLDKLAPKYFQFQEVGDRLTYRAHLLGQRVLFACTLANMNYTLKKNMDMSHLPQGGGAFLKALNDSCTEKIHSETRVFDMNFVPISSEQAKNFPLKWVQSHQGEDMLVEQTDRKGQAYAKFIKNLDRNELWREFTATLIASGAFPLAFEPVVLNRYKHEYGERWLDELSHLTKYPFTYVDGGLFDNEPIQEAYRLAAYLDAQNQSGEVFDRQLIFVDPNVSELDSQFRMNVHNKISISRSLISGKSSVGNKSTVLRLAGKVPQLLSAVLNEAHKAESGRIAKTVERLQWRDIQRKLYQSSVPFSKFSDNELKMLKDMSRAKLDEIAEKLDYPINSLQIQTELWRVAKEESGFLSGHLPIQDYKIFMERVNEFVYSPAPNQIPNIQYWSYLLLCLSLDISLDLIGKTQTAKLIPIAPFDFYKNDYSLLQLPGAGMAGFAGFTTAQAGGFEVRYGQYCAYRILSEIGLLRSEAPAYPIPKPFDFAIFDPALKKNVEAAFLKRFKELIPSGLTTAVLPFVEGLIADKIRQFIEDNLTNTTQKQTFELRVRVPQELFVLRGFDTNGAASNRNSLSTLKVNGEYYLLTQLSYDTQNGQWSGGNVNHEQTLYIDKVGVFSNSASVGVKLPTVSKEAFLSPNPVFILDVSAEARYNGFLEVKADRWIFYSEVIPLDETLWGEDKIRNLYEKL